MQHSLVLRQHVCKIKVKYPASVWVLVVKNLNLKEPCRQELSVFFTHKWCHTHEGFCSHHNLSFFRTDPIVSMVTAFLFSSLPAVLSVPRPRPELCSHPTKRALVGWHCSGYAPGWRRWHVCPLLGPSIIHTPIHLSIIINLSSIHPFDLASLIKTLQNS